MLIGLMGYAQSGKDTVAAQLVRDHGFVRIAFADVLRECLYALDPIVYTGAVYTGADPQWPNTTVRLAPLVDRYGWDHVKVNYPEVRALLQRLGTEVGRNILGQDIWVETAMRKANLYGNYVFTDVRFPNEYEAIRSAGEHGRLVRILRPGTEPVNAHPSETALDGFEADLTIINSGSLAELEESVTCLV